MSSEMKKITSYHTLNFFRRIPLYSPPAAWYAAGDLRSQQNKTTFKIALKDKLMEEVSQDNVPIT
jgi:hypothetical protein